MSFFYSVHESLAQNILRWGSSPHIQYESVDRHGCTVNCIWFGGGIQYNGIAVFQVSITVPRGLRLLSGPLCAVSSLLCGSITGYHVGATSGAQRWTCIARRRASLKETGDCKGDGRQGKAL